MNRTEPSTKTPSAKTGLFATLRASLRARGTAAPSIAGVAIAALLATAALLALTAAPASAATCAGPPPAGSSCIFAGPIEAQGAGQVADPNSVAVDQSTGDVYVGEGNNARVSEFDKEGHFLRAFGFGVRDGADELQTCTTVCIRGLFSGLRPAALAVDNSGGASNGDLYVFNGSQIEKYKFNSSTGEFELVLEPFGSAGTGPGQFSGSVHPLAVDHGGNLWVGDQGRVEQFSEGGAFLAELELPEVSGAKGIGALALDSAGDFYVINHTEAEGGEFVPGVRRYSSTGNLIEALDASGHPNALALDPATGDLFVSDQANLILQGTATLLEYDPSGAQTEAFGSGEVVGHPQGNALAFGDTAHSLYVVSSASEENSAAQIFTPPAPGPLPIFGTSEATEITKTAATLCAEVNPEGASTTVHFEYVDQHSFETEGGFAGPHTKKTEPESAPIGSDFSPHLICRPVSSLQPATAYRFRVVATNANATLGGVNGEAAAFAALPPAAIDSTGAAEVTADSATLEAEINPLGDATSYHFEFLTEAAFLAAGETFAGAAQAPLEPVPLGAGSTDLAVSQHIQGLQAGTTYRFRVVIRNKISEEHTGGDFAGPVRAFTTQIAATAALPDHRAWEQVSPPDKHGASFAGIGLKEVIQASAAGDAIIYGASAPTEPEPQGNSGGRVLSARGSAGWASLDLDPPHQAPTGAVGEPEYRFFSPDLSLALLQRRGSFDPSLSPQASEQTPYLRADFPPAGAPTAFCASSCYRPLVTGAAGFANVPPGTEFGGASPCFSSVGCGPHFLGASPDLAHVVLESDAALTSTPLSAGVHGLYEWSADAPPAEQLRLLSLLPNGEPVEATPALGFESSNARNAISPDGSRVVFAAGQHLYLRLDAGEEPSPVSGPQVDGSQCAEPALACTVQLDALQGGPGGAQAPAAHFQLASDDGSRLFFTDSQQLTPGSGGASGGGGDLYEYDLAKPIGQRLIDLTPESGGEAAAVQGALPGASADASYLYFVANGALAAGAVPGDCHLIGEEGLGACSLYLIHNGTTTFIATLSGRDYPDWIGGGTALAKLTARVSPDGRWFAFMSERPLSGYDNRDAVSGKPDEEVYLYHAAVSAAEAGTLVCASCNPTGARPHGVEYGPEGRNLPLAGGFQVWANDQWLAANIPGWTSQAVGRALYQSRYLSDSGRLFFNSSDALVPADTNGAEDVYQYEPPQGGEAALASNTCTTSAPTHSPASQGCVDLISSGTSSRESAFLDASESGDDVFFLTNARLAGTDTDSSRDVYDARVEGGFPEAVKPVECSGDACQPPAVPPNDPTPGSLTFQGAGNLLQCPKGKVKRSGKCVAKHHKKKHPKKSKKKAHKSVAKHNRGGHR